MKKKTISLLMSAAILTPLLAGCGARTQTASADTETVLSEETSDSTETVTDSAETPESGTVALTVWAEENNHEVLGQMIESFKQEYAGQADFEITLEVQGDATAKDVLLGDIHNGADVFSFPDDQLSGLIAAGALAPVPNADEVSAANLEEAVSAASYNGTLYAYPMTADNGYFLYYDKRYLTDEDVQTMDGLLAAAQAAGKQVSMEFNSGWYLYSFFGGTGMDFGINDDGVTNHCNWNTTEGSIKGTDVAQALLDITANPAFIAQPDADFVLGVEDGSVVAGISGVWNAVSIKNAWGEDYGATKLPTYTCAGQQIQMSSFTGYKMIGVNAYSAHKDWALKLADWLTNEENQTLRFTELNQGPSNSNAAASDEVNKVPAITAVIEQSQYGNLQRVGNSYWNACTAFADTIAAGNPEGIDLQELMDTLVAGITSSTVQ